MAEHILNTRIQLKYDSYKNWVEKNPTLLSGEVAIAYLPPRTDVEHTNPAPAAVASATLIKVGPGAFNSLPWLSATAADVYAWAKKENPDWTDFPALPVEVVDNGTGKFVTDVEYADNKITISRSDVDWTDIQNKPDLVNSVDAEDKSLNVNPTTGDVKIKVNLSTAANNTLELKDDGLYVPAPAEVTLPSVEDNAVALSFVTEVDQTAGAVSNSKAKLVQGDNITLSQNTVGGDITIAGKDWSGEIAAVDTGVMQVDGKDAIKTTGEDIVEVSLALDNSGNVVLSQSATGLKATIDLSEYRKIADDEDTKYGLTYDSEAKQIKIVENGGNSYIDASDFVVDGMLESVVADQTNNTLTFTWNTDGKKTVTTVELDKIADIYTGVDGTTVKVEVSSDNKVSAEVKTNSIKDGHIASDAAIAETKLAQGVQDALALARTALQEHQNISGKADKVANAVAGNFAGLDANGNLTDSGSKASDFATAAQGAKADSAVQSVSLASGTNNGTLKLTVDGNATDNIQVTGLGSAAYQAAEAFAPAADYALKSELPVVNDGKFVVSGTGALTGSGEMTANQSGDSSATLDIADKGVTSAKIADYAVGAQQVKANKDYTGDDAEVWIFYCGTASELV